MEGIKKIKKKVTSVSDHCLLANQEKRTLLESSGYMCKVKCSCISVTTV